MASGCTDSSNAGPEESADAASEPETRDASHNGETPGDDDTERDASSGGPAEAPDASDEVPLSDAGAIVRASIEASEGGSIVSADGIFTLFVPADSIEEDTEFSIRVVPESEWPEEVTNLDPASAYYDVQPDGLSFSIPAIVQFDWPEGAPAELLPEEGELAALGEIYSRSAQGGVEISDNQAIHYGPSTALTVSGEIDHLSGKWVGTNRGCRVSVEAPVGDYFVGNSFSTTRFELNCSESAASALTSVSPLASSSNSGIVTVGFSGTQRDSVLIVSPGNTNYYRPGPLVESFGAFPMELSPATFTCADVGSSSISAGVGLTRSGSSVSVTGRLGEVNCIACELTEQDCTPYQELNPETCMCDCQIDGHEDCPEHKVFEAETCDCRCIADPSDCADNQAFNNETCACECAQSDEDCGEAKHVDPETCECACDQVQNCMGATPTFSDETCSCVCEVTQEDCPAGKLFDQNYCDCACPDALEGNATCPSDLQYYDTASCGCLCTEDEPPGSLAEYCAQFNKRFDAQACDCVCDLDPATCTGNLLFDDVMCQCYCPLGDVRQCDEGYLFDENACACVCDTQVPCDSPDFARNPETCECECILDEEASCFPAQVLNPDTCECECEDAPACDALEVLNEEECACECNPALPPCTPPLQRDEDTCECVCEQSSVCPPETPHFNTDACACECDLAQLNCAPPTPYADLNTCACVPHVFYFMVGQIIQTADTCSDADEQFVIQNVTDTGFDVVGLTTNGTVHFTVNSGTQATANNVTLYGMSGHTVTMNFGASTTFLAGSGSFFGSSSNGSCSAGISFAR